MYYKVVSNRLESARCCVGDDGEYSIDFIQYKIKEWVKPFLLISKLFVFDNLEHAKLFKLPHERIFECEVKNPTIPKYICKYSIDIGYFWYIIKSNQDFSSQEFISEVVPGTVLVDEVMLTKEIL